MRIWVMGLLIWRPQTINISVMVKIPLKHIVHAKRCEIGAEFRGSHDGLHPLEGVTSEAPVLCPLARGVKLMGLARLARPGPPASFDLSDQSCKRILWAGGAYLAPSPCHG